MVEETAAAIMSLQQDTQVLSDLVGTFRVSGNAPVPIGVTRAGLSEAPLELLPRAVGY